MMMPIRLTRAVKTIAIVCIAAFLIQQTSDQFLGGNLLGWLALIPSQFVLKLHFWQVFTYAFLHGDVMHLFLNLLMLVFIGSELESFWGTARFLRYYFFCTVSAGLLYLLLVFAWKGQGLHIPMVGASGGIYGLLMAYGLIFGERVLLFMLLFPMKAKHFVWVLAAIEFFSTVFSGRGGGLSSAAHVGGLVAGFGYLWGKATYQIAQRRRLESKLKGSQARRAKRVKRSHLKLIIDNEQELGKHFDEEDADPGPKTWH